MEGRGGKDVVRGLNPPFRINRSESNSRQPQFRSTKTKSVSWCQKFWGDNMIGASCNSDSRC